MLFSIIKICSRVKSLVFEQADLFPDRREGRLDHYVDSFPRLLYDLASRFRKQHIEYTIGAFLWR